MRVLLLLSNSFRSICQVVPHYFSHIFGIPRYVLYMLGVLGMREVKSV